MSKKKRTRRTASRKAAAPSIKNETSEAQPSGEASAPEGAEATADDADASAESACAPSAEIAEVATASPSAAPSSESEAAPRRAPMPAPVAPAAFAQPTVAAVAASLNHPLSRPPIPVATQSEEPAPIRGEWQSVTGRDVAALLDPRPTLVVGAIGRRDEVGFATIIWATPISHEPSMVAFSLRARSHTMSCLQKSRTFSLNVLPATPEGVECCEQCGTRSGYQFNKIVVVKHHLLEFEYDKTETVEVEVPQEGLFQSPIIEEAERTSHIKSRVPIVDCATSWLACDVDHIEEAGDHLLVIGTVIEAQTCAVRNDNGLLVPQDVLECVQHGCYAKVELLEQ